MADTLDVSPGASEIAHSVFRTLRATNAKLERFALLGDDLALAIWQRQTTEEETAYARPGHHTLSYYLGGGYRTEREDLPGFYGAPGRLCTLPDDHESTWVVRDDLRFLHLYFLPAHFTRRAVLELNREPRELTLADRTYFEHAGIGRLCNELATQSWQAPDALLRANETSHAALSLLLRSQAAVRQGMPWRGGLAPVMRRRLADYIEATSAMRQRSDNWQQSPACRNITSPACFVSPSACRRMPGLPRAGSIALARFCVARRSRCAKLRLRAAMPIPAILRIGFAPRPVVRPHNFAWQ